MNLDSFWTWVTLYWIGGVAWIGHRLSVWRDKPPVERPEDVSPRLFFVSQVVAAVIVSPLWPLDALIRVVMWASRRKD